MNKSLKLLTLSILPFSILLGQNEGQSGGGDSAAEASVTGSASQKAVTAPEALEGNPVVSFLKQGISLQKISAAGGKKALKVLVEAATSLSEFSNLSTKAKSNSLNLAETVSLVNDAKSKGVSTSLNAVATRAVNIKKLDDSGLTGKAFTDALTALRDTSATVGDNVAITLITLADDPTFDPETFDTATLEKVINGDVEVKDDDTTGGSFSVEKATFAANVVSKGTEAGLTVADADAQAAYDQYKTTYSSLSDSGKDTFETKVANTLGKLVGITTTNDDGTISNAITISSLLNYTPDELEGIANIVDSDARHDVYLAFTELFDLQDGADNTELITEITGAASLLNQAFKDRSLKNTDSKDVLDEYKKSPSAKILHQALSVRAAIDNETIPIYKASDLVSSSYTEKAAKIAAEIGLLGSSSESLINQLFNSQNPLVLNSDSTLSNTAPYLKFYTGSRGLGDNDLSSFGIPLQNLSVLPGKNIELEGYIDVSELLPKATLSNNKVEPNDINILAFASGKDFIITDDLVIENSNEVEDHALVLSSADDFYLRSERKSSNANDYKADTENILVEYRGSNLAIASVDSMHLVNVDIKTGGNLAIGTLDELHIGIDGGKSSISVGTGGNTPNPDLVLLYANDLITLNNVDFVDGMIREIHLDAPMMELRNLAIPSGTLVKGYAGGTANNSYNWASKEVNSNNQPYLQFERANLKFSGSATSAGDVILKNITHGSIGGGTTELTEAHFNKTSYTGS